MNCPNCGQSCMQLSVWYCRNCEVGWVYPTDQLMPMPCIVATETDDERALLERCWRLPAAKRKRT